ncbi:MAG: hypothetical protein IJW35_04235 [Lentisphaeria bacterium]|nr:hypothetical protein [Lentisphaeria bacterium]
MKTEIIRIFLIILLTVISAAGLRADISLGYDVRLRRDISGSDGKYLRQVLNQLEKLRKLEERRKYSGEVLTIIPGRKKFYFNGRELFLPGDALTWESDPELRRKLYGVLAAQRFNLKYPPRTPGLSPWIVAGLDNGIMSAATAGQYIAGNSGYGLISALAGADGKLPDFGALCRLKFPVMAIADDFAAEQSRLLLEIFARNGRLRELFAGALDGKSGDFWLHWYPSAAKAQDLLQQDAAGILFDRYNPMPVDPALNRIAELEIFFIPETDAAGKPTGKITDGDIAAFCTALEQERPDRAALRRAAISRWRQFGRTLAVNERELCQQIADSLLDAGESSGVPARFNKNVAELKKTLLKRQKNSAFLTQVLDRMTPPMLRLRTILRVWEQDGSPLSDRQREFFTRTLDLYLR